MKKAQSLIEYALILSLVTIIAITALQLLGKKVDSAVKNAGERMETSADKAQEAYCQGIGKTYDATTGSCKGETTP